jgi:hypothetical protein
MKITHPLDWFFALLTITFWSLVLILGESIPTFYLFIPLGFVLFQTFRVGYTVAKEGLL